MIHHVTQSINKVTGRTTWHVFRGSAPWLRHYRYADLPKTVVTWVMDDSRRVETEYLNDHKLTRQTWF